ncbi:MAG: alpha-L-rhamnosidase-related protein, partial [Promethearchaeota archaeon]
CILGKKEDEHYFEDLSNRIANKINATFFNAETGLYHEDSQSAQALSLYTGLIPASSKRKVLKGLIDNIKNKHGGHLTTGIVGSYFLYQALGLNDANDVAYEVITAKGFPGFEYMINYRAETLGPTTTLWEDWEGRSSLCHPVQGCVVSWFYEYLAGIRPDVNNPGFKYFKVYPAIIDGITEVKASLDTMNGLIVVEWQRDDSGLHLKIVVPINCMAEVRLPSDKKEEILINGIHVPEIDGLDVLKTGPGYIIIKVGSGEHVISVPATRTLDR